MAEMIIPGTYIEVRAEGLISAGRVATGILGVIGTAARGPVGEPTTLAGLANARDLFGAADPYNRPEDGTNPLTLLRALEYAYGNGASTVIAVRVAGGSRSNASFSIQNAGGDSVAVLTARTPGTWGNDIRATVEPAEEDCRIDTETHTDTFDKLNYSPIVPSPDNQVRVFRGTTKAVRPLVIIYKTVEEEDVTPKTANRFVLSKITNKTPLENVASVNRVQVLDSTGATVRQYGDGDILYGAGAAPSAGEVRINSTTGEITFEASQVPTATQKVRAIYAVGHADSPEPGQVLVTTWDGILDFAADEAPQQADGDRLMASYRVDRRNCVRLSLAYGTTIERYTVPDGRIAAQQINGSQRSLVTAEADETHGGDLPKAGVDGYFGTGSNTPGNNGADAGTDEYSAGLEGIANQLVNIVVLAGQDADTMGSILLGHLNATEQTDHERIGVIGAKGTTVAEFLGQPMADGRVIVVAPGIALSDGTALPSAYTAAAVAGLISGYTVQTSLTNKTLNVPGLSDDFNRGEQEQLIGKNVLAVVRKDGFRVVKGITTSGEGTPFAAIPTRRIVDYAKYGVRSAANPYIGRLNNARVRSALKATLDAFLTRMVEDEALTGYDLQVSATRAQEIAGEVSVVMTIQPTFSIDFIRVVMNLK